MTAEITYH